MRRTLSALAGLVVTVGLVQPAGAVIAIDLNDFSLLVSENIRELRDS